MIDAIEKFDLERAIKFETYAISRIKGAIIDELRAIDWIPRSVRYKAREVEKAYAALEAKLHRTPTESEVAGELGITLDELHTIFSQVSFVNVIALDELLNVGGERGDKLSLVDTLEDTRAEDPVEVFETEETKYLLSRAINTLPEREKIVVTLVLLRGPHPRRDRPGARRHREPHLSDAHQGRPAAARQAGRTDRLAAPDRQQPHVRRAEQAHRVDVAASDCSAPMQATAGRPAGVGGSRHLADELARHHAVAGADDGIDRLVRGAQAAVADRHHPATGQQAGVDDDAGRRGGHALTDKSGQVDAAVAGVPTVNRWGEGSNDAQRRWQRRMKRSAGSGRLGGCCDARTDA